MDTPCKCIYILKLPSIESGKKELPFKLEDTIFMNNNLCTMMSSLDFTVNHTITSEIVIVYQLQAV